jgi:hypothetical protein
MPILTTPSHMPVRVSCKSAYVNDTTGPDDSFNHGQTCCAGSRIYVQKGVYDEFAEKFKAATAKLQVGSVDMFERLSFTNDQ